MSYSVYYFYSSLAACYSIAERRHETSPSVIVIGAGFAGLAAARALYDASFQVCPQGS